MLISDALKGVSRLAIDTAPFIYFVERTAPYVDTMREIFKQINDGDLLGYSSVITLAEVLVLPIRTENIELASQYRRILTKSRYFILQEITPGVAERAAALRAKYNVKAPDALQVASALEVGCEAFLTHDFGLRRILDLKIIIVGELELTPNADEADKDGNA